MINVVRSQPFFSLSSIRSRRESLISKITETDNVCACQSFLLMVAADKESAFYYGDPELVSKFFSQGISINQIEKEINVRPVSQPSHEFI